MKLFLFLLVAIVLASCGGGKNETPEKEKTSDSKAGESAHKKMTNNNDNKTTDAGKPGKDTGPADLRQEKLKAEYDKYADTVITHSAAGLSDGEKKMLAHLLKAAELVEKLHMVQLNPKNLEWKSQVDKSGTEIEKKIFERNQMPWCVDDESTDCCALSLKPEKKIGLMHWPVDLDDKEYENLGAQINGKELLSPFTVVKRGEGGKLNALPYSATKELAPMMKELAKELRAAAVTAPHKSLKKFLKSRAAALESDDAYPYDDSDYDWIALKGDWEVTVGPYETYKNPRQLKAMFEMYVGREDKKITAELMQLKSNLQEMENALGKLVGPEIYKSRKLDPRIAIRAVDIWMAAGDGRKDRGATVAFHLPNRGKSVDEGLYKKVIMVNHSMAFEPVSKARAELVLDKAQLEYVNAQSDIKNVTFHELSHGFGAYHEMKVTNPKGKTITVKEALKEYDSLLEELKADTFGLWLLSFQRQKKWADEKEEKLRYTSAVMHILGLLQYPLPGTYPRMVAIQLGWYMDAGAITFDENTGRFSVHFDKMPAAVESLVKKVATIQLTGDYDQAKSLIGKYIVSKADNEYELKGKLATARKMMLKKFVEAGITSPSLRYSVKSL